MKKTIFTLILALTCNYISAQDGVLDLVFDTEVGVNTGSSILKTAVQPDGKIIIGGDFSSYKGVPKSGIARINTDGSIDNLFNTTLQGRVLSIAIQNDGKIIIGGFIYECNGVPRNSIARLNPDGSLDQSFNPILTYNQANGVGITDIAIQNDGKIIVVGRFNKCESVSRNGIVRLFSGDGSLDQSFNPGSGFGGTAYDIMEYSRVYLNPDGTMIVSGGFSKYNNISKKGIVRVNSNGSIDNTFSVNTNYLKIKAFDIQDDGKIIIAGDTALSPASGHIKTFIQRVNSNGLYDASFITTDITPNSTMVNTVYCQPNGKIIIGGNFQTINGISKNGITRLNVDGSVDQTFESGTGVDAGIIECFSVQSDGKMIIAGKFNQYNNTPRGRIARINANANALTVESLMEIQIDLFPNPASTSFTITNAPVESKLTILDVTGKTIYRSTVSDNQTIVQTSNFNNGIYFIHIEFNGSKSVKKLILNK